MLVKWGTTRIVIIIPALGIALKFPRIYITEIIKCTWYYLVIRRSLKQYLKTFAAGRSESMHSLYSCLFAGLTANQREYAFYMAKRNPFAWPTRFSLLGLVNIQRISKDTNFTCTQLENTILEIVSFTIALDYHCFENPANFCVDNNGKLRQRDYASSGSQIVMQMFGNKLSKINGLH
jgi:hypothetical protein